MEMANYGFTAAFTLEMGLKLTALGGTVYWADTYNRFDGFVVVTSLVEIAAQELDLPINAQALRALRLLRVFKLLKSWKSLQRLLSSLLRAVRPLAWLLLLFALVLFIFALLGMQFYGNQLEADERPNFDNIGYAMLAVTIVATKEDWNELWMSVDNAVGGVSSGFFVALIVVGAYLLMNLLIATLISKPRMGLVSIRPLALAATVPVPRPTLASDWGRPTKDAPRPRKPTMLLPPLYAQTPSTPHPTTPKRRKRPRRRETTSRLPMITTRWAACSRRTRCAAPPRGSSTSAATLAVRSASTR
jgi:hypothetical protein